MQLIQLPLMRQGLQVQQIPRRHQMELRALQRLSQVRATQHGGDLQLQSVPGKGTTARFRLPFSEKRVHLLEAQASEEGA